MKSSTFKCISKFVTSIKELKSQATKSKACTAQVWPPLLEPPPAHSSHQSLYTSGIHRQLPTDKHYESEQMTCLDLSVNFSSRKVIAANDDDDECENNVMQDDREMPDSSIGTPG